MNKNKYLAYTVLFIALFAGCCFSYNNCGDIPVDAITEIYTPYVDQWKSEAKLAFEDAENKIFSIKPKPIDIVGPDPDVSKCICKGTGIIVQGDGHKTVCPYHGNKTFNIHNKK